MTLVKGFHAFYLLNMLIKNPDLMQASAMSRSMMSAQFNEMTVLRKKSFVDILLYIRL